MKRKIKLESETLSPQEFQWYLPNEDLQKRQESREEYLEALYRFSIFVDVVLHNCVKPVIKGKVTDGKLRWRSISINGPMVLEDGSMYHVYFRNDGSLAGHFLGRSIAPYKLTFPTLTQRGSEYKMTT